MKNYTYLFLITIIILAGCKKEEIPSSSISLKNTVWYAKTKNNISVVNNRDKEYLFFFDDELENYYDFIESNSCFDTKKSTYSLNNGQLILSFVDEGIEIHEYKINNNELEVTFNYENAATKIVYEKISINKNSLVICN